MNIPVPNILVYMQLMHVKLFMHGLKKPGVLKLNKLIKLNY